MKEAYLSARKTFKYFWREKYWENRRIIKGLNLAMAKMRFEQGSEVEHMWIDNVDFNGDKIFGTLINAPGKISNVSVGDSVSKSIDELSDWLFVMKGKTYGGFTIHAFRSTLDKKALDEHDKKWGINFGSYNDILVVTDQKEKPTNLVEHPMCINMAPKVKEFYQSNPDEISYIDDYGQTLLHSESIAGNKSNIEVLINLGANKSVKSKTGKTALDYANVLGWDHIKDLLK